MPTIEAPMRWRMWSRFGFSGKLLGGRCIHFNGESMSLRFLLFFVVFFSFVTALMGLDEAIQAKKFAKGCNVLARGGSRLAWCEL